MRRTLAIAVGGILAGCVAAEAPTGPPSHADISFAPGQHPYGVEGSITQQQLAYLRGLAWPQSYDDMVNTFGFPAHRTAGSDYYRLEDGSGWAVIEYSGPQATGYRTE